MLRLYASVQVDLVQEAERLLALAAPDERPERLPAAYAELLGRDDALRLGRALTWDTILRPLPAAVAAEHGERVASWLRMLLAELEAPVR